MKEWNVHEFKGTFIIYIKNYQRILISQAFIQKLLKKNGKEIEYIEYIYKEKQNKNEDKEQKEIQNKYLNNEEANFQNGKNKSQNKIDPMSNYYSKPLKERIALRLNK